MTKEELATERNEVREILEGFSEELSQANLNELSRVFCLINGDEKRITELEKRCSNYEMKISKMEKGTCDVCKETEKDKKIVELETRCNELFLQTCEQAEKIKEMKSEIENDRDLPAIAYMQGAEKQKKKDEEQLTKAKDHIKNLLDCLKQDTNDPQTNYYVVQYMTEAEQFIKDSEVENDSKDKNDNC